MNPAYARWIEMSVTAAVGLLLFLMPRMSNRCLLFGVPVGDAFRRRPEARNAIAAYQWTVGAAMLGAMLVLFLTPPSVLAWARALSVFVLVGAPMVAHAWQFRRLRQFALPILQGGELELNQAPDALPRWLWLNAIPPLALVAAAAYASANWAQIPERFPIHWGLDGQPDRWTTRSTRGVYGPLVQGALLWAEFLAFQLATWYGSRRRPMRLLGVKLFSTLALLVPGNMAVAVMQPFLGWRVGVAWRVLTLCIVALWVWIAIRGRKADIEPTPNECWRGGMIYFNPNDAALIVERRDSLGWTFNFANSWAWLLAGSVLLVAAAGPLILR